MILEVITQGLQSFNQALLLAFPYFFPISLILVAWRLWRYYIVRDFLSKQDWVLLEVKLPKEHQKTPKAMEVVLGAFYQFPAPPTFYDYWWIGKVPLWFSLEMVSIDGHVHFILRIPKSQRSIIESHIYSQYPQAELHQVPDYVGGVNYDMPGSEWSLFGMEHTLVRADAYPIKTYVDYGIDRELLKEEQKVDPLTSTIEFMGSIGKGEQVWIQIMIMAAQPRFDKPGTWFQKEDWKGNAKAIIDKMLKRNIPGVTPLSPSALTAGEREVVEAIERNISKMGFDCGIRTLYLGKGKSFNPGNISSLFATFRQYGSVNLNSFKPVRITGLVWWKELLTPPKFPIKLPFWSWELAEKKREIFQAYVHRGYFHSPFKETAPFTLNTEELATIYHFPGAVAETPTFGRIGSKRSEAPVNLPI